MRQRMAQADWLGFYTLYRSILARVPRTPTLGELEPIGEELSSLADEIVNLIGTSH